MIAPFYSGPASFFGGYLLGTTLRLCFSGLLLASAAGKVWDIPGARQALAEFGVRPAHAGRASQALISTEFALAVMLLLDPLVQMAARLCALLFLVFSLGVARVLQQGRSPDCHCLGQLHSAPVSPRVLARNLLLVLGSIYLACHTGFPLTFSPSSTLATLCGAGCVGLASSHLAMWKSFRQKTPSHLKQGQLAPHLDLQTQGGQSVALHDVLRKDRRNLLVFSSPGCNLCAELRPELQQLQKKLLEKVQILLIERNERGSQQPWVEGSWGVSDSALATYKLQGTPSAVLLDGQGRLVMASPATGPEEILALIRASLDEQA